jgi:hypothetical protein
MDERQRVDVDANGRYWGGAFVKAYQRRWDREPKMGEHVVAVDGEDEWVGVVVQVNPGHALLYIFDFDDPSTYWVEDASLSAEETLRRFEALRPEPTCGPLTHSAATTVTLTWPDDAPGMSVGVSDKEAGNE